MLEPICERQHLPAEHVDHVRVQRWLRRLAKCCREHGFPVVESSYFAGSSWNKSSPTRRIMVIRSCSAATSTTP